MPGTCQEAADVAVRVARTKQPPSAYEILSRDQCWDAVAFCAFLAGVVDEARYHYLKGNPQKLITVDDLSIDTPAEMHVTPPGQVLGFFEYRAGQWVRIHTMLSTGDGRAAGNKNDCIGVGSMYGWEVLDLVRGVRWRGDRGIDAPRGFSRETGQMLYRPVKVCCRPITDARLT